MRKILVAVVAVGITLLGYAPAQATTAAQYRSASATALPSHSFASAAPSQVTGYSLHCRERMRERGITRTSVRLTVQLYWTRAVYNPNADTWRYHNPGNNVTVVLNNSGFCVTVWK